MLKRGRGRCRCATTSSTTSACSSGATRRAPCAATARATARRRTARCAPRPRTSGFASSAATSAAAATAPRTRATTTAPRTTATPSSSRLAGCDPSPASSRACVQLRRAGSNCSWHAGVGLRWRWLRAPPHPVEPGRQACGGALAGAERPAPRSWPPRRGASAHRVLRRGAVRGAAWRQGHAHGGRGARHERRHKHARGAACPAPVRTCVCAALRTECADRRRHCCRRRMRARWTRCRASTRTC